MNLFPSYLLVNGDRLAVAGKALILAPGWSVNPADGLVRMMSQPVIDLHDETVDLNNLALTPDFDPDGQPHQPGASGPVSIKWPEKPRVLRLE